MSLPVVIASSVIRSAHQGESHGGVYLVDLESSQHEQVIDWNDQSINWEGRGLDRGLRGIAFYRDQIYLAASDEIFVYDKDFEIVGSIKGKYLKHCHEICICNDRLYVTSTGYDSILVYDLTKNQFESGYILRVAQHKENKYLFGKYDPNQDNGPIPGDTIHINNVFLQDGAIFIGSLRLLRLVYINNDALHEYASQPHWTHNIRPYREGILANLTEQDRVAYMDLNGKELESFCIPRYSEEDLSHANLPNDHARQAFGRGLCVTEGGLIVGGSSPATISVYQFGESAPIRSVNLTMDVRNAIHGLEVWPF